VSTAPSLHGDLAELIRRALLPQPFPYRRDVKLYAGLSPIAGKTLFHDHFWLSATSLATIVAATDGDDVNAAMSASGLRELLRAALTQNSELKAALGTVLSAMPDLKADIAIAVLDLSSGALHGATMGDATASPSATIKPDDIFWLSVDGTSLPTTTSLPATGLRGIVTPALPASGGCKLAVLFKKAANEKSRATYAITNDPAAIPTFLGQLEIFLAHHGLSDMVGVDIALDELLTNAISYAFADGRAHEILVELAFEDRELAIEMRDDGTPFNPLDIPPPDLSEDLETRGIGGLGMHFVRTVMDDIAYSRAAGWNVLSLKKRADGDGA
jgi:anti-sigma regulatory factor (Ser/Thr protein kinase)